MAQGGFGSSRRPYGIKRGSERIEVQKNINSSIFKGRHASGVIAGSLDTESSYQVDAELLHK
jgi:hypothetical protein